MSNKKSPLSGLLHGLNEVGAHIIEHTVPRQWSQEEECRPLEISTWRIPRQKKVGIQKSKRVHSCNFSPHPFGAEAPSEESEKLSQSLMHGLLQRTVKL
jgi:hypothetical protein